MATYSTADLFGSSSSTVPENLVNAVIQQESRGNPNAVSPVGARGLMQIMPATAMNPGFGIQPIDPRTLSDPEVNRKFGTAYLGAMLNRYGGDVDAALAAYNAGPGRADRYTKYGKDPRFLPAETRDYITKVKGFLGQQPQQPKTYSTAELFGQPQEPQQASMATAPLDGVATAEPLTPTGVTIAPKGGTPRMATPEEAQPYKRASILPAALNQNTGSVELAVPGIVSEAMNAATLPGDVYVGRVDPNSPEAGRRAAQFALLATPAARAEGMQAAERAFIPGEVATSKIAPPTTEELKSMSQLAYKRAEEAGLTVSNPSFRKMAVESIIAAKRAGIDPTLHPKATAALKRLASAGDNGNPLTLQELDTLRQVIKDAASSPDAGERRIAGILTDRIDDYMSELTTKDVVAGDARTAVNSVREARSLWSRMRKSELFDQMQEKARDAVGANYTAAGLQTALRQQARGLVNNKRLMRGFTNDEKAAIRRFVRGGPLENFLRLIGKFSPQGVISTGLSIGGGFMAGGPVGGMALPLVGMAAKKASTSMGMKNFERAGALIRRGQS